MRPLPMALRPALPLVMTSALCGCDLALASVLSPGLGRPMTGRVLDARTKLPVGGATVLAGLGSTVTDAAGQFRLFGNFASDEISIARAGYVALTQGGLSLDAASDLQFELEPLFTPSSGLPMRFLQLNGAVRGLSTPATPALVSLGGVSTGVSNGLYALEYKAPAPGRILTAVLAWGSLSAPYAEGVAVPQAFHFLDFAYQVGSWRLGDTIPEAAQEQMLQIAPQVPIQPVRVQFSNLGNFRNVQTEVALDFGALGYVPVARSLASNQTLPVPALSGLKYVVQGEAIDASGKQSSSVSITTNDPGKASLPLLPLPKIEGPANGASGVGQRPTFRWTAIPHEVSYELTLREVGEGKAKWIGRTSYSQITYPGFALNDINGGALRPERKYTWSLRAVELLEETELPDTPSFRLTAAEAKVPMRPFRTRKREVEIREMGFAL
ncbi:MAG: carboxypeptidase-like regulatory domain-containing protein [Candidatus Sericytochromatia bacterium]|nr:carboxypeptidase-like regulatory domain-containing protein [Candidatus Sericytochromatia bacterium]